MRARFDAVVPLTVGIEEEVLLLDPQTYGVAPVAGEVLARFGGDPRVMAELPAAQIELITEPCDSVPAAIAQLRVARRDLAECCAGLASPAAAGFPPIAPVRGRLSEDPRFDHMRAHFGPIAELQLVSALQVHVAVGGAQRTLRVHNALRSFLPEVAALAANAPFVAGLDSGLASVRPVVGRLLPRQGVPPPIASWDEYADAVRWGSAAGVMPTPGQWWWEVRPHPTHGTLEIRVPDTQATIEHAGAVAAVVHSLVAWLARRCEEDGGPVGDTPTWRIEENRWSAARHGVDGEMADLVTGAREPTRERLERLLGTLAPTAADLGCAAELALAGELVELNGAARMREAAGPEVDARAAARWLTEVFI